MKKLLSFITAGALLLGSLGLASCSGDLHDNATQPLFITGSAAATGWGIWDKCTLVESDGSVQKYEFIASNGAPEFKLSTAASYNSDIAGDDINPVYPALNGDFVALHSREAEGLPDTKNVIINDCTVGEKYTINIKFDAVTLNTSVSVTGSAVVMPVLNLASTTTTMKNFPAGKTYTFTRSGTVYTYEFISNADETLSFYIDSSTAGLTYGGADLSVANAPLTVYDDTEMTAAVKKDHKYKLTVNVPTLTTATITAEKVSMLEKATISANWKYAENFYEEKAESGAVQFFAENTDFEFTVNRVSGDNTLAWGTGTIAVDAEEAKELTYNTDGKAKTVKVTGLKTGTCYKIILTEDKVNFKLSAKVITVPKSDLSKFILAGAFGLDVAWGGWFDDSSVAGFPEGFKATATSEADVYAFTFTATDTSHEFAIHEDYNWAVKYCDGVEVKLGNDYVDVKNGGSNAKVTGLTAGKTYKILAKNGYGKITCKVEEVK